MFCVDYLIVCYLSLLDVCDFMLGVGLICCWLFWVFVIVTLFDFVMCCVYWFVIACIFSWGGLFVIWFTLLILLVIAVVVLTAVVGGWF